MPITVELHFDPDFVAFVEGLWQTMDEEGYLSRAAVFFKRPHITLSMIDDLDEGRVAPALLEICRGGDPLSISFSSVGSFGLNSGVLFLGPIPTQGLMDIHLAVSRVLDGQPGKINVLYSEGNWTPHCTLGVGLSADDLVGVLALLGNVDLPVSAIATDLVIVRYPGADRLGTFPLAKSEDR